jgi:hypothetical protein
LTQRIDSTLKVSTFRKKNKNVPVSLLAISYLMTEAEATLEMP